MTTCRQGGALHAWNTKISVFISKIIKVVKILLTSFKIRNKFLISKLIYKIPKLKLTEKINGTTG